MDKIWLLLSCETLIFAIMKILGLTTLSWLLVFSPLWVPIAFFALLILGVMLVVIGIAITQQVRRS